MSIETWGILAIAVINCINTILTSLARSDIRLLEKNTNSKMDQLIATTAKASKAEGKEEQRIAQQGNPT